MTGHHAHYWLHWLSHFLGLDNLAGPFYGFWSGVGSDLSELALIGALIGGWRHLNCHTRGCWRLGKHPVGGTPYKVCRKHHPNIPDRAPTAAQIREAAR